MRLRMVTIFWGLESFLLAGFAVAGFVQGRWSYLISALLAMVVWFLTLISMLPKERVRR